MRLFIQLGTGIVLSGLIGFLAYRRGSLTVSGAVGAVIVGTAIFGFGGWVWGLVLITFFVLSTLLSHYKEADKEKLAEKFAKGLRRDLGQALANGGAGALIALVAWFKPGPAMLAAFVGALATVNADTWATELGVLSKKPPRLITTWKPVEVGTSGGVSALGTLATLVGALVIGMAALLFTGLDGLFGGSAYALVGSEALGLWEALWLPGAATVGGLAGSVFDSILGATIQGIFFCPACAKETEKALHTCGTETRQVRGWRWLNNDMVNFISSVIGALVAVGVWWVVAI